MGFLGGLVGVGLGDAVLVVAEGGEGWGEEGVAAGEGHGGLVSALIKFSFTGLEADCHRPIGFNPT